MGKAVADVPAPPSPPLVLVVDDDAAIREALREVLEPAGYAVAEAANGLEAFTYLERNPRPGAILLDLFMPVMNGWQLAKRIESVPALASVPLVVVTASGAHWGYPSKRVLRKPIDLLRLLQALHDLAPVPVTGR